MKFLSQVNPDIGDEEAEAVAAVVKSGWITEGAKTEELYEKFKELSGFDFVVAAPNGTLSLFLGLKALGISSGDEVIVPSFSFYASASSVSMAGATPVFADVCSKNYMATYHSMASKVTPKTKAFMPVDIYGDCMSHEIIKKLKTNFPNIKIISDSAQSVGVVKNAEHAGLHADIASFSFFADKTVTMGEGGLVATNDRDIYEKLRLLRNQGRLDRGSFVHPGMGWNFRITDMQAAIGVIQLSKLEKIREQRHLLHSKYGALLDKFPSHFHYSKPNSATKKIPFRFAVVVKERAKLMDLLEQSGVQTRLFFHPLHLQPYYRKESLVLKNSEFLGEHGLCLPIHRAVNEEWLEKIGHAVAAFANDSAPLDDVCDLEECCHV